MPTKSTLIEGNSVPDVISVVFQNYPDGIPLNLRGTLGNNRIYLEDGPEDCNVPPYFEDIFLAIAGEIQDIDGLLDFLNAEPAISIMRRAQTLLGSSKTVDTPIWDAICNSPPGIKVVGLHVVACLKEIEAGK